MTSCIPQAVGVPGMWGEAPQWWDPGGSPRAYQADILDPRWNGAVRHSHSHGTATVAACRGVHMIEGGKPWLYLSWQVLADPTPDTERDGIFVGFRTVASGAQSAADYIIRVNTYSSTSASFDAQAPAGFTVLRREGGTTTAVTPPFPWLGQYTRAWYRRPSSTTTAHSWAVAMRVPVVTGESGDQGLNLGDLAGGASFRFWYAITTAVASAGVAPYYFPRGAAITNPSPTFENVYPAHTSWDETKLGSGAGCGNGISLLPSDVGTTNSPPHEIKVSTTEPVPTNTLYVRPRNTGPAVPANAIRATFRTANWGSQADFTTASGSTAWEEILPDVHKVNTAQIADGTSSPVQTTNTGNGAIEFEWQISTGEARKWVGPTATRWAHQCMLVTLAGGNVDFVNDSVYRNMDFVQASKFERLAELSVEGLEPVAGGSRPLYLWVERLNMPSDLKEPEQSPDLRQIEAMAARGGDADFQRMTAMRRGPSSFDFDELAQHVPTIRYHLFAQTDQQIVLNDRPWPVLVPQTSFGYFVHHEGEVYGWDYGLDGRFEKVEKDLFVHEVEKRVVIRTRVQAHEEPPGDDRPPVIGEPPEQPREDREEEKEENGGRGCGTGMFALLALSALAVRRLRR